MKLFGLTLGSTVKIGVAAVLFILAFKTIASKTGIPALQRVAGAV